MIFAEQPKLKTPNCFIETKDSEKEFPFISVEIIEYIPNSVVIKTIVKKSTGDINVISENAVEGLVEKMSPLDTFVQVVDGNIELVINGELHSLTLGQSIIIPANSPNYVRPKGRFKMLMTAINKGYE